MTDRIKLVQGDNLPYIRLTLKNADDTVLDVSNATVTVHFRAKDTTNVLSSIVCTKPNGGADGIVVFYFTGSTLNVDPGYYEGEVEISFSGIKQTVYDTLQFQVRAQFA
jgi:hypothetical protein